VARPSLLGCNLHLPAAQADDGHKVSHHTRGECVRPIRSSWTSIERAGWIDSRRYGTAWGGESVTLRQSGARA